MLIVDKSTYKLPQEIRNVLLIQLGDIGDLVWMTPGIRAVKNSIPCAKVSLLVQGGFGGLLAADPSIDRVFEVKKFHGNIFQQAAGQLAFLKDLRAQRFDLVIDLRLGDRGAFMSFATGAPLRMSLYHPEGVPFWRYSLFTHGIAEAAPVHTRGAADQSLRLLRELGIDTDDIIPRLWIAPSIKKRVQDILINGKLDKIEKWITINPFSRWQYKEWNNHRWVEIINWLWRDFAITAIITGSPEEKPKAEALIQQCAVKAFNFAGLTTLEELAGLLSMSGLHIGVDSAAPHIAAATGTPTITIYGPSSWQDWAPVGDNHRVILPEMKCVPCRQKGCDNSGQSRCLEELSVDQVKKIILETLKSSCPHLIHT